MRLGVIFGLLLGGCGPNVAVVGDGDGDTAGHASSESNGDAGGTTTSGPGAPGTSTGADGETGLGSSSGSDGGDDLDSGGFVCASVPGAVTHCTADAAPPDDCDTYAQDCPAGQRCVPWTNTNERTWNGARCTEIVAQPGAVGDPCLGEGPFSGLDNCGLGLMCFHVDATTNTGLCVELCGGSVREPTCDPGYVCPVAPGMPPLCVPSCDPLIQDCDVGQCTPADDWFVCSPDTASIPDGQPCQAQGECVLGSACIESEAIADCQGEACCLSFCDLSEPDPTADCLPGQECTEWFLNPGPPDGFDIGICAVPLGL